MPSQGIRIPGQLFDPRIYLNAELEENRETEQGISNQKISLAEIGNFCTGAPSEDNGGFLIELDSHEKSCTHGDQRK